MKKYYENIIVGGGIVGAGIFRDLCLHQEEVLLIDKNDFTSQTSQRSSKMLHGGIRYLENFDFRLVYEALHEKIYWTNLLPHLAKEVPFVLPVYQESKHPKFMIKIALMLYDFLSGYNNSPHQILSPNEVQEKLSGVKKDGLVGAGLYYDSVMDDAKITLEIIYDGLIQNPNSHGLNYHEVIKVESNNDLKSVSIKNVATNEIFVIECKNIVFALGPFTDKVLTKLFPKHWTPVLLPSKGSHIWVSKNRFPINHPLVINHQDGRVIFFIPNQSKVLIGTTEVDSGEEFENPKPSKIEIDYLLNIANEYFPEINLSTNDIESSFAGIRPLIKENRSENKGKTARTHKVFQIGKNIFVIAGGKYTTFRVMGQEITKNILISKNKTYHSHLSLLPLKQKSIITDPHQWSPNLDDIRKILQTELPKTINDIMERRIGIFSKEEWIRLYPEVDYDNFIQKIKSELIGQLES